MLVVGYCIYIWVGTSIQEFGDFVFYESILLRLSRIAYLHDTHLDWSLRRYLGSQPVA